ncbi:hypothetical protein J6590_052414 [Homalodisca vitripennis]|nr:hypothetical protein J6590_052414 [Homalodisca vitripennis]
MPINQVVFTCHTHSTLLLRCSILPKGCHTVDTRSTRHTVSYRHINRVESRVGTAHLTLEMGKSNTVERLQNHFPIRSLGRHSVHLRRQYAELIVLFKLVMTFCAVFFFCGFCSLMLVSEPYSADAPYRSNTLTIMDFLHS